MKGGRSRVTSSHVYIAFVMCENTTLRPWKSFRKQIQPEHSHCRRAHGSKSPWHIAPPLSHGKVIALCRLQGTPRSEEDIKNSKRLLWKEHLYIHIYIIIKSLAHWVERVTNKQAASQPASKQVAEHWIKESMRLDHLTPWTVYVHRYKIVYIYILYIYIGSWCS